MSAANATMVDWPTSTANSLAPVFGLVLSLVAVFAVLGLAVFVYADVRRLRYVRGSLARLIALVRYFFWGIGTLAPLAALGSSIWWITQHASRGSTVAFAKWTAIGIAAFLLVAGVGWLAEKWAKRIRAGWQQIDATKQEPEA